jgi:site-specific DNA recombinase
MMVVCYARVSTENQLENYSIEEQIERLKSYCKAKDWTLLKTYVDGGYSGGNTDRPALQQMLAAIRETQIDAVVVYKLDRLSRSQKDTLTLIEDEFLSHGTDFVSINENFDTSTPFGRAMIGILSVFAQLEKDQITERFTMGRIGRGKAGFFHGGGNAPTGYSYIDGLLQINEYEAIQVQEVFDLFLAGKSINAIWRSMSARYVTKWSAAKVRNILQNSIYIGKVKFGGQEYDGAHKPIIAASKFAEANHILHSFSRESRKTSAQKNPFRAGYLLSGMIYCAHCGARYTANHGYYKCYSRAKSSKKFIVDPNCRNDNWKIEDLDTLVESQAAALAYNKTVLDNVLKDTNCEKLVRIDKSKLKKHLAELDAQIDRLIELYQLSTIPMDILTHKVNELSNEKTAIQREITSQDEVPAEDLFLSALDGYSAGYKKADIDEKRMYLRSLIDHISIDGKVVKITWRL